MSAARGVVSDLTAAEVRCAAAMITHATRDGAMDTVLDALITAVEDGAVERHVTLCLAAIAASFLTPAAAQSWGDNVQVAIEDWAAQIRKDTK